MLFTRRRCLPMRLFIERLEARQMLAAQAIISEFLADNDNTLDDGNGNSSDWIELHNPADEPIDLIGWHLTDTTASLTKWTFPSFELGPGQYGLVFASGEGLIDRAGHLHTNFSLHRDGEYVALVQPDGTTIASEFGADGIDFPQQFEDVSYGVQTVGGGPFYFPTPTPGRTNRVVAINNSGPAISEVTHQPVRPTAAEELVVTAKITASAVALASATLTYRVMYGDEASAAMSDDGVGDDAMADDGYYTATIPAAAYSAGEMVRYYITTTDTVGNPARKPEFFRPEDSAEYFGTVVHDPAIPATQLPILEWFVEEPAWHREPGGNNRDVSPASVFYDGAFYDNIHVHVRGRTTQNLRKPNFKFDFLSGENFHYDPNLPRLEEFNLQSLMGEIWTKTYMRNPLGYQLYRDSGSAAPISFYVHVRQNGQFHSLAAIEEEIDVRFLERNGLNTEAALYEATVWPHASLKPNPAESHFRKETREDEGYDDLREFTMGLSLENSVERERFVFDNVNIPQVIHYLAVTVLGPNHDRLMHNYYVYRDTGHSDEWGILPWDLDRWFPQADTLNNPSVRSIFYGDSDHERVDSGNPDQYNRLNDAIFDIPSTREMFIAHLRSVVDEFMNTSYLEDSVDGIVDLIELDAALDNARWGIGSLSAGASAIKNTVSIRRSQLDNDPNLPPAVTGSLVNLIPPSADVRALVPVDNSLGSTWLQPQFDDAAWTNGTTGVGYETLPAEYADLIGLDASASLGRNASVFVRVPFQIKDATLLDSLTLRMKYDDGFVACLNGVEVARGNAPDTPTWNSRATASRDNADAIEWETFTISDYVGVLQPGQNVLAIHGMNISPRNADLLILPQLVADSQALPDIDFGQIEFSPASGNQDEEFIELANNSAAAVDISGWRLTGGVEMTFQPGTVIPSGGTLYVSPDVAAFRARGASPTGGEGHFVQGDYGGHISSFGETIQLVNDNGATVATVTTPAEPTEAQQYLRVSELQYNPAGDDATEFVELTNISHGANATTLHLEGVSITQGPSEPFVFPVGSMLGPGQYVLVVKDQTAFQSVYPNVAAPIIAGQYTGSLSNGGEQFKLNDANGSTIFDFVYDDEDAWPESADGAGASLELLDPLGTPTDQLGKYYHWRGSTDFGGSPGQAGRDPIGVVINEVLANADRTLLQSDSIELFNPTDAAIDVGGWFLSDSDEALLKLQIPAGTVIGPGEYLLFDESHFNPNPPTPSPNGFALNGAEGDDVWLVIPDGIGGVSSFVDDVHFGASPNGESFGRLPHGERRLAPMRRLTLACGNSHPRVGPLVISEIHYNPDDPSGPTLAMDPYLVEDDLEFVEVHNPTAVATLLNDWRLSGGVGFDFGDGTVIGADETLVVVSFNPASPTNADRLAAFRVHYALDASVRLVGGWAGQLSDGGEVVRLERPGQPRADNPALVPRLTEDEVFYDDRLPWGTTAGGVASLQRAAPVFFGNDAMHWVSVSPTPGHVDFSRNTPGDLTGDGRVDANDIDVLSEAVHTGSTVSYLDLDESGSVDAPDRALLIDNILGAALGDANLDGVVDGSDFNAWNDNRLQSCYTSWSGGDFTGDGVTDGSDFNLWLANRFTATAVAAVAPGEGTEPRAPARKGVTLVAHVTSSTTSGAGRDLPARVVEHTDLRNEEAPRAVHERLQRFLFASRRGFKPSSRGSSQAIRKPVDDSNQLDLVDLLFGDLSAHLI
jgi:hypothetical protein